MKYKEYALKINGEFLREAGPHWGTTQVAIFDYKGAMEEVKNSELLYVDGELVPQPEVYVREVEVKTTPWVKRSNKKGHQ